MLAWTLWSSHWMLQVEIAQHFDGPGTHTYAHTDTYVHTHLCTHTRLQTCTQKTHTHTHKHTHTRMQTCTHNTHISKHNLPWQLRGLASLVLRTHLPAWFRRHLGNWSLLKTRPLRPGRVCIVCVCVYVCVRASVCVHSFNYLVVWLQRRRHLSNYKHKLNQPPQLAPHGIAHSQCFHCVILA